jgi:hypothetical protein
MSTAELDPSPVFDESEIESAPVTGADFFNPRRNSREKIYKYGLAPVDELTKMPLPILPPDEIPPFDNNLEANWHHLYHPSHDKLLNSASGLAVRHLRLQLLPVKTHHSVYHNLFERPEFLTRTNEQRFGHVILGVAGYIPRYAIDLHADNPVQPVIMSNKQRRRLQSGGEIQLRGQSNISNFIKNHLIRQDFSNVNESVIEEFIETRNVDRKRFLGHWLLAIASEVATEPVSPVYKQALDEGLVIRKYKLPSLAKAHVNGHKTSEKAIKGLHKRLAKDRS